MKISLQLTDDTGKAIDSEEIRNVDVEQWEAVLIAVGLEDRVPNRLTWFAVPVPHRLAKWLEARHDFD